MNKAVERISDYFGIFCTLLLTFTMYFLSVGSGAGAFCSLAGILVMTATRALDK